MIKTRIIVHLVVILSLVAEISIFSQSYSDFLEKVQLYQNQVSVKTKNDKDILDPKTFNSDNYFNFFKNLNFNNSRIYGVHYQDNFFDGKPYLYSIEPSANSFNLEDSTNLAQFNVKPKDSERGYLEYLFFYEMGDQFALKWHANYKEKYVIYSESCIDSIINEYSHNALFKADKQGLSKLKEIDPTPILNLTESECTISWIEIHTHYGIYFKKYSIAREEPYTVSLLDSEILLTIQANFLY